MYRMDFKVVLKPGEGKKEIGAAILRSLTLNRIKHNKPSIIFIAGNSGEGKSYTALRIQEIIFNSLGLDLNDYIDDVNIYHPIEYSDKMKKILYDKAYKKVKVLTMHEAREVVKAKLWHSFVTQAISDVNAQARAVKRMVFIIVSQTLSDIAKDMRKTINYYCHVERPLRQKARLRINRVWFDDRDLENLRLRHSPISGIVRLTTHRDIIFRPKYIEINLPNKELRKRFNESDHKAKYDIIRHKLDKIMQEIKQDSEIETVKVKAMVKYYMDKTELLQTLGKYSRGKWRLHKDSRAMHDLTDKEAKDFELQVLEQMKERGMV